MSKFGGDFDGVQNKDRNFIVSIYCHSSAKFCYLIYTGSIYMNCCLLLLLYTNTYIYTYTHHYLSNYACLMCVCRRMNVLYESFMQLLLSGQRIFLYSVWCRSSNHNLILNILVHLDYVILLCIFCNHDVCWTLYTPRLCFPNSTFLYLMYSR